MLNWFRAGTFSWQKLCDRLNRQYPEKGDAVAKKLQDTHGKINRRLAKPQSFPRDLLELCVEEWINFREIPADLFEKLGQPAHQPLLYLISARSRTSDRYYGTRTAEKRLKEKPDVRHLQAILEAVYFPFLDQQFKETIACHRLPRDVRILLLKNLRALMLSVAWFALMEEKNRTIQEVLAYWQEGNFILSIDGPLRSAVMLALPANDK